MDLFDPNAPATRGYHPRLDRRTLDRLRMKFREMDTTDRWVLRQELDRVMVDEGELTDNRNKISTRLSFDDAVFIKSFAEARRTTPSKILRTLFQVAQREDLLDALFPPPPEPQDDDADI